MSLSAELDLITHALDALRLLADPGRETPTNASRTRETAALHASAVILRERLRMIERAVRDTVNPALVLCDENRSPSDALEGSDIVLAAWTASKEAAKLREETQRVERRLAWLRHRTDTDVKRTKKSTPSAARRSPHRSTSSS